MKRILLKMIAVAAMCCATGAWAAISPTVEASFAKDANGCYLIGSADDLYGFAAIVNGTDGNTANKSACGKLTANIQDNSNLLVSTDGNLQPSNAVNSWTPMVGFTGVFDGAGYTVSGLYYKTDGTNAGFFASVSGGAVIKNLHIADSYFRTKSNYAGGIVAQITSSSGMVAIDNCSFSGTVAGGYGHYASVGNFSLELTMITESVGSYLGGLIGSVDGGTLVLSNSYAEGRVLASWLKYDGTSGKTIDGTENTVGGENLGGLIGYVQGSSVVDILNCYTTSKVDATESYCTSNAVSCRKDSNKETGGPYDAVANVADGSSVNKDNVFCNNATGVKTCTSDASNYSADPAKSCSNYDSSKVYSYYNAETIENIIGTGNFSGVTFSDDGDKLVATLSDADGVLSIPQNIKVDSVVLNRTFNTALSTSTVMLPFEIAASNVENAEFFNVIDVTKTGGTAETEDDTISAYKPYLVKPTEPAITFKGAVTLQKTSGNEEESYSIGDWSFRGRIINKTWLEADVDGKAYTYSPMALSNGIAMGEFAKIGKNVRIRTMRAYLYYTGTSATPLAKAPAAVMMATTEAATADTLPANIPMTFIHKDIVVAEEASVDEPISEVAGIDKADPETTEEHQTQAIQPIKTNGSVTRTNKWYDFKGRSLGKKPTAHGAYVNNHTSVIVK